MRLIMSLVGVVAGAAALAACGGGDRASVMAAAKSECLASAAKSPSPGINAERACTCVVDRVSEGKTDAQVREIFAMKDPPPEAMEAIGQCMVQEINAK